MTFYHPINDAHLCVCYRWANDFPLFHGLLYAKTKGLAEEAVKAQGFANVALWRWVSRHTPAYENV
jgi:hypothetical protein